MYFLLSALHPLNDVMRIFICFYGVSKIEGREVDYCIFSASLS